MKPEREAGMIDQLAKEMGDAGYCNYTACREYLVRAYRAGAEAQRELLDAAVESARVFQAVSQRKGLALEQIAALPLGDHRAKKLAQDAIGSAPIEGEKE